MLAGNFYRFVAQSMSVVPTESIAMEAGKLSPYTAVVIFTLGIFISNFVLNTFIIYKEKNYVSYTKTLGCRRKQRFS